MWDAIRSFKVCFKITKELIDDDGERETLLCFQNAIVVLISEPLMNLR